MGLHYVPQKYLRGFAEIGNDKAIWMYDKKLGKFTNPGIKSVAQEAGFYSDEVEQQLNELIEKPANRVLDKLRSKKKIDEIERIHLSVYIATMIKRVPKRRKMALSMAPSFIEKNINEIRNQVEEWASTTENKSLAERRLNEIREIETSFRKKIPEFIIDQVRLPWASQEMVDLVSAMFWYVVSPKEEYFITSDNPAYFFEAYGIGNQKSEMTFPISRDLALFTSWKGTQNSIVYREVRRQIVRQANKRIASGADRFVFSHRKEDWIAKISDNPKPYLSRIEW